MRTKIGLTTAFVAAIAACEPLAAAKAAEFRNVVVSAAQDGRAQATFASDTPEIFVRAEMADVQKGSVVTITWLAVDTGTANPPNFRMNRVSLPVGEKGRLLRTSIVRPGDRWIPGSYRVRLDLDGRALERIDFTID